MSSKPADSNIYSVSDLLDVDSHSWKVDVLKALFLPAETAAILQIPTNIMNCPATRICHMWKNGKFSVRSAYHLCHSSTVGESQKVLGEESSSEGSVAFDRKTLWDLKTKPKIKMFIWKCLHNALL
ncbi:hypothetical protein F0562_025032 [Nyssa sinensis]|uniref:Reverse transcriptase zinc-binding domain-containing protein n=1 Tax=Nyssa sinensis TaxID=561372 RepID=A0A5J5BED9_9ASTE|nr:hypothetical protein F0562_025032 [Nyssa sinensis]